MLKGDKMTQARFELNDYTTRVLDVIKGKYGLKNRNEALNRFVKEYGEIFVEPRIDEKYLIELDNIIREHEKKYGKKSMSEDELDQLLGID